MKQSVLTDLLSLKVPKSVISKTEYKVSGIRQSFINYCKENAKTIGKGCRRELIMEKNTIHPILKRWMKDNKMNHFNYVKIELYESPESYIGWHTYSTKNSSYETISICSFALHHYDIGDVLCDIEFDKMLPTINIRHQTCISFNSYVHSMEKIRNRVKKHFAPRIALVFQKHFSPGDVKIIF